MAESVAAVMSSFLASHKLDKDVCDFILADTSLGLGCESVSDFAGYFTATGFPADRSCLLSSPAIWGLGQVGREQG